MRAMLSPRSTLAAAAICAAASAIPAAAQTQAPAPRPVAVYRIDSPRSPALPGVVTVSDSGGQLVASFRYAGARVAHPMMVTVLGPNLVLQAETPTGVLTLELFEQHDPQALTRNLDGRWWLGDMKGKLRGRGPQLRTA